MDLRTYWLAIKAGWKIVLGAIVVTVAVAGLLSRPGAPQYISSASLFVAAQPGTKDLNELYQRNAIAQQRIASYVVLATSDSVADEVSEAVGFTVPNGAVQSVVVEGTVIMEISVTDSEAERAHEIATAYGEVLPEIVKDLEQVRDGSEAQVQLQVIDEADLPEAPVPTPMLRNLLAALILGLGAGVGLAVLRYALAQGKKPPTDAAGAP